MSTPGLFSLSRKEGWNRYVTMPARQRPDSLTRTQLAALSTPAREEYDDQRHDWHANSGIIQTPQLASIHEELDQIVASNRQDGDRIRSAAVIDALPGLGKTTIANQYGRSYDRQQRRRLGPVTADGNERVSVFRVGLTSNTTLRTLNQMICEFYGHPATSRATAQALASHALDCVLSCESRLGIIDDIHFIDLDRKDGLAVSNHLKWLANELPVTFVYVGVGLAERRFFADGLSGKNTVLAQTARRWTRLGVDPFHLTTDQGRRHWRSLVKASERQLVLAEHRPGALPGLADYLFERTSGHIGSYFTLLTRGCYRAIRTGAEALDRGLLDQVRLDEASEQARQQLAAALTHGTLSSEAGAAS
ncbi:AAA family ATPase [Streptomyces sp. NPDC059452]|uniref:AAA family ATPase n=1 Tax=Streptomyces sp. NPDC059452 TaxID=3346835 RepID=UPI0036C5DAE4